MPSFREGWLRARSAFLIVFLSMVGCGALFIGLELAGMDDCRQFPGVLGRDACERFGSIAAAAPWILLGAACIVFLFKGSRWLKEPPTPPTPPLTPRSRRITKIILLLIGLWMIVDGGLLVTRVEPCSDLKIGAGQYKAAGDGLAKLCEWLGPWVPGLFFIGFGGLILFGLYKGMLDGE